MTVPAAPLPALTDLLRALIPAGFRESRWTGDGSRLRAEPYRLGRHALAAVVEAARRLASAPSFTLWLPGYMCNEALAPLRRLPVRLCFYPVEGTLAPDWPFLDAHATGSEGPAALVLVHYFGVPNETAAAAAFCRRRGMLLIEDAAHMLLPTPSMTTADAVVFSPHKLLPIADCGVLVATPELHACLPPRDPAGARLRTIAWLLKRTAQRAMVTARISWHRSDDDGATVAAPVEPGDSGDGTHPYVIALLDVLLRRAHAVVSRRRDNYLFMENAVRDIPGVEPFFQRLHDDVCPYVFPLSTPRVSAARLTETLRRQGIPASRWPDLPPEVEASASIHRRAISLYEQVVLLPVHQTLLPRQLEAVVSGLRAAAGRAGAS